MSYGCVPGLKSSLSSSERSPLGVAHKSGQLRAIFTVVVKWRPLVAIVITTDAKKEVEK